MYIYTSICLSIYLSLSISLSLYLSIYLSIYPSIHPSIHLPLHTHAHAHAHTHRHTHIHTYKFVVVNVDDRAQASDFQIEKRQVVFMLNAGFEPWSLEPNLQQTECPLTNRLSYRGSN